MIDLYTWTTPNGRKVSIMLEELGIDFRVKPINIGENEQFTPEFLAISPNNKIPALVDHETGVTMIESGAILLYLADKYQRFISNDFKTRLTTIEWLMWQMGGVGPAFGQVHTFVHFNPGKAPFAEERVRKRNRELAKMAADPTPYLKKTEQLVTERSTHAYAQASQMLADLREALAETGRSAIAEKQAQKLKQMNPTLRHLTAALRRQGFVPK